MKDFTYSVNVGLWFNPADVKKMRECALPTSTRSATDRELFEKAAIATENGMFLVVQSMTPDTVIKIVALFRTRGIQEPLVQELNLESTKRGLKLRV